MPKTLATTFARELRSARRARGLTQAELAERVGVAVEVCGRLERGRALPRAETLARLSAALGVSADVLLGLAPAGSAAPHPAAAEPEAEYARRPEIRRLMRHLGHETPRTVRLLGALLASLRRRGGRRREG